MAVLESVSWCRIDTGPVFTPIPCVYCPVGELFLSSIGIKGADEQVNA